MSVKSKAAVIVDKGKVGSTNDRHSGTKTGRGPGSPEGSSPVYVRTAFLHRSLPDLSRRLGP